MTWRTIFVSTLFLFGCLLFGLPWSVRASPQEQTAPLATVVISTPTPIATPVIDTPQNYTVQTGDTVLEIAIQLSIDLHEMGCLLAPDYRFTQPLVVGDTLRVLPQDIHCHQVMKGDTVELLAVKYGTTPLAILGEAWNGLDLTYPVTELLPLDRYVRVPVYSALENAAIHKVQDSLHLPVTDGFLPWMLDQPINSVPLQGALAERRITNPPSPLVPADWPYGSGHFSWPVQGWITQGFRKTHRAVDIAAPLGTPILASDRGVVKRAGWNNQGYGRMVIIDHQIDYVTLYAHLDTIRVKEGEVVAQGQVIGTVGSTGNSTGAHLHFEIRDFGRLANPLDLLGR